MVSVIDQYPNICLDLSLHLHFFVTKVFDVDTYIVSIFCGYEWGNSTYLSAHAFVYS